MVHFYFLVNLYIKYINGGILKFPEKARKINSIYSIFSGYLLNTASNTVVGKLKHNDDISEYLSIERSKGDYIIYNYDKNTIEYKNINKEE